MGGLPAHAGDEAGFDTALDLVVRLIIADGIDESIPFVEIGIALGISRLYFGCPDCVAAIRALTFVSTRWQAAIAALGNYRHAFAAMGIAGVNVGAPVGAAPVHDELGAVGKGVFHRIRIEILIHPQLAIRVVAIMPAAQRLGLNRPRVFHPAEMIDVMDVEVAVTAAAGPEEAVETGNLPEQFARLAGPFLRKCRRHGSRSEE